MVGERTKRGKKGSKYRGRSRSEKGKKEFGCYKCNKIGHLKLNYPLWKKHLKDKKEKESINTIIDLGIEEDLLVVSDVHRRIEDSWILDSAYSHHYMLHWS